MRQGNIGLDAARKYSMAREYSIEETHEAFTLLSIFFRRRDFSGVRHHGYDTRKRSPRHITLPANSHHHHLLIKACSINGLFH
jgi:hypothetical protein